MNNAIGRVTSILSIPYGYTVSLWSAGALIGHSAGSSLGLRCAPLRDRGRGCVRDAGWPGAPASGRQGANAGAIYRGCQSVPPGGCPCGDHFPLDNCGLKSRIPHKRLPGHRLVHPEPGLSRPGHEGNPGSGDHAEARARKREGGLWDRPRCATGTADLREAGGTPPRNLPSCAISCRLRKSGSLQDLQNLKGHLP